MREWEKVAQRATSGMRKNRREHEEPIHHQHLQVPAIAADLLHIKPPRAMLPLYVAPLSL